MFTTLEISHLAAAAVLGVKEGLAASGDTETPVTWTGQWVMVGGEEGRAPRVIVYLDTSVPGAGYGEWFGTNASGEVVSSEDISEFF